MDVTTRKCRICKIEKPITDFTFQKTNGPRSNGHYLTKCKTCAAAYDRDKRGENRQQGLCACGAELTGFYEQCDRCRKGKKRGPEFKEHNQKKYQGQKEYFVERGKKNRDERKLKILTHYCNGEKPHCQCSGCSVDNIEFLTIDHIGGGGNQHRKKVGNFPSWIIRNNFPPGFRVLCMNCNMAYGVIGYCPHQRKPRLVMTSFTKSGNWWTMGLSWEARV